jgi:sugar/nucleoside kinase (ribokinase family)
MFAETRYLCFASLFVHPLFTPAASQAVLRSAKEKGCIVCADMTKRKNNETEKDISGALRYIDILFANRDEAELLTGEKTPEAAARKCLEAGAGCVVVKKGADGCCICTGDGTIDVPAYRVERCLDTTGAGDTFAAGFIYAHSRGMALRECGMFANAAASLCVEHVGASDCISGCSQVTERFERMQGLGSIRHS